MPTRTQGIGIGVLGLVVVGLGRGGDTPLPAPVLRLAGAPSWGIGNVVARSSGIAGGLALTVWSALVVPVPALAVSLLIDGPGAVAGAVLGLSWQALVATLYTAGLASLVGYGIFTTLIARNPPAAVVPWVLLVPPIAMLCAWALLGAVPRSSELAGGAVMLLGCWWRCAGPPCLARPLVTRSYFILNGRATRHQVK